jgi:hypothetical protein
VEQRYGLAGSQAGLADIAQGLGISRSLAYYYYYQAIKRLGRLVSESMVIEIG